MSIANRPRLPQARRPAVHHLGEGFVQVVPHFGFMDPPDVLAALSNIVHPEFGFDPTEATCFLGKESVLVTGLPNMAMWREHLSSFMHRNAANAAAFFRLPHDRVVEVGVQVPI